MRKNPHVRIRGGLGSVTALVYPTCLGQHDGSSLMEIDDGRSTAQCVVLRLSP